jgi:uncharacterized protein (TIGR02099 family)
MSSNPPSGAAGSSSRSAGWAPLRSAARVLLWLLLTAWLVLFVGWLSLHWLILPHIEDWRPQVEERASAMLGAPIRIGAISAHSSGWVPALELRDVRVLDSEQRVALTLPRVFAALSARSFLAFEPRFAQLLIDGASLDVRRDKSGRIRVAGLDFGNAQGGDDDMAADWFFKQHEFVIRAGTLRWIDETRDTSPLALADVQLVIRNGLREHDLRIDATPPAGWGERFNLRGRFVQPLFARSSDWRRWSGRAYVDVPRADLSELRRRVTLPFELNEGDGALRGWFDLKDGQPTGVSLDVALRAVALRLDKSVEPLAFEQVAGRIDAEKSDERTSVSVRGFGFRTGDGLTWPQSDLRAAWRQDGTGAISGGEFDAERLDLGVIAEIASGVPIGSALRALLADAHPRGLITQLRTRWDGPIDAPEHYRVKGRLSGLSLVAKPAPEADAIGRPGISNADLQLEASESGGQARIDLRAGRLDLPGVFAQHEVPLDLLEARLSWKIERDASGAAPRISAKVAGATFANADAKGELSASWRTGTGTGFGRGERYPGLLELDGRLIEGVAAHTARYLPLGLPEGVRSYVAGAVREGTITSATFRVRGDLADFPFHDVKAARDAELRIAAKFEGLTFAYVPDDGGALPNASGAARETWPPLTGGSGEIVVDRSTIDIRGAKAQVGNVDWSGIQGRVGELGSRPRLEVDGVARGPLNDMLRFVDVTPIGRWTGKALGGATATGSADLNLALVVPLTRASDSTARGTVVLAGNDIRMSPDTPLLAAAKGRVDFSQRGFTVSGASAHVLGGELMFEGGSSAGLNGGDGPRFSGRGTATAEAMRQASELGLVARIAAASTGQAGYRATLAFVGGRPQVSVATNLIGVAVDLPAPLGKAAPTPLTLRVRMATEDAAAAPGEAAPQRETLQVDAGGAMQAQFVRERSGDMTHVVRGAVRIADPRPMPAERVPDPLAGEPIEVPPLPADGVAANIVVNKLDVEAWQTALGRIREEGGRSDTTGTAAPLVFDASGGAGYVPDAISLRVAELDLGSRRLSNVTAGLSRQGELWRASVGADELEGYIEYRPARRAAGAGRVYARLARLSLPKGEVERVESLLDSQPAGIPALDVVADEFELRGKHLGRLEIEATNRAAGNRDGAREWQLAKLNLTMPEAQFSATGTWGDDARTSTTPTRRAAMTFTLTLVDSGALLERLGMGQVVRGGKGSLTGDASWPGSPFSPDYAKMTGQIKVAIDSGQFLKAGPGAARLLSVLSLQSLPRRLSFDFRDLFAEGFAFDNVVGDVRIGDGRASTNNLRMRGAAAVVLMEGSADLERETEDLRVVIVPEINAGTASLAFAVINPAIGLGTFLAQYFLRKPLMAASTREFKVTGPWDDPKVERVERNVVGDAAAAGAAAPVEPARAVTR